MRIVSFSVYDDGLGITDDAQLGDEFQIQGVARIIGIVDVQTLGREPGSQMIPGERKATIQIRIKRA